MDDAPQPQAATWATRIVARYAQAAEPGLSLTEEKNLHSALATALCMVMPKAVPEWVKAVNLTLDQWEKDNCHPGPRIHNLDLTNERMSVRWPDEWPA